MNAHPLDACWYCRWAHQVGLSAYEIRPHGALPISASASLQEEPIAIGNLDPCDLSAPARARAAAIAEAIEPILEVEVRGRPATMAELTAGPKRVLTTATANGFEAGATYARGPYLGRIADSIVVRGHRPDRGRFAAGWLSDAHDKLHYAYGYVVPGRLARLKAMQLTAWLKAGDNV